MKPPVAENAINNSEPNQSNMLRISLFSALNGFVRPVQMQQAAAGPLVFHLIAVVQTL